jgi:transcriptional regulator with XRE-family HTH domain
MIKERLRALREKAGLSQTEMGKRMGLSFRAYSRLENEDGALHLIHVLAAERVALGLAAERHDPSLVSAAVRRDWAAAHRGAKSTMPVVKMPL